MQFSLLDYISLPHEEWLHRAVHSPAFSLGKLTRRSAPQLKTAPRLDHRVERTPIPGANLQIMSRQDHYTAPISFSLSGQESRAWCSDRRRPHSFAAAFSAFEANTGAGGDIPVSNRGIRYIGFRHPLHGLHLASIGFRAHESVTSDVTDVTDVMGYRIHECYRSKRMYPMIPDETANEPDATGVTDVEDKIDYVTDSTDVAGDAMWAMLLHEGPHCCELTPTTILPDMKHDQ